MIGSQVKERRLRLDEIRDDDPDLVSRSYVNRILDAYVDMRASTRAFIQTAPSEGRLLFLALLSDVIFFMARSISMVVAPPAEVAANMPQHIALALVLAFLLRTGSFYVIAAAATVVSRLFGGKGGWYRTRCAVFWAALVSAPIELVGSLFTVGVSAGRTQVEALDSAWLIETPYFIGPIAFGYFLAAGVAEAQGFRYIYQVMAVLAVLGFGLLWLTAVSGILTAA